jgi:molybdopterin-containing oxidoreductase family iron-sulfur binding subunit
MIVDLGACSGCNACVAACNAENNVPPVGRKEVLRGRQMHWIRIDTYYEGSDETPAIHQQPVLCMHCENAPCEPVCPVGATVHGGEGLNEMVYNRCVGSRYCVNNCPYKVRRFNFHQYAAWESAGARMRNNPEVTVRTRGVVEKCTYCVQRIQRARLRAEREGRRIADGEATAACQAACPSEALVFGDLSDPESRVAKLFSSGGAFALLGELGTRPRTRYLARARNPNAELEGGPADG